MRHFSPFWQCRPCRHYRHPCFYATFVANTAMWAETMRSTRSFNLQKPFSDELHSEWASERMNESSGAREQSEQCGASEWVSSESERANGLAQYPFIVGLPTAPSTAAVATTAFARYDDGIQDEEGPKTVAPPLQPTPLEGVGLLGYGGIAYECTSGATEAIFQFLTFSWDIGDKEGTLNFGLFQANISGQRAKFKNCLGGAISMIMSYGPPP